MKRGENVILVGFMGCGKTTVGRALARRLGWRFLDLDRVIERRGGGSVRGLFRRRGEEAFRRLEAVEIRRLHRIRHRVVAAGGGAPVAPRNRYWLKRAGVVVYLRVPVPVLVRRLRRARNRPLLAPAKGEPRVLHRLVASLLKKRERHYAEADFAVPAKGPARRVANSIARRLERAETVQGAGGSGETAGGSRGVIRGGFAGGRR